MYDKVDYNFWKQVNPEKFDYDGEYKDNQSTNFEMSSMRLGWLSSFIPYEQIKTMNMVDIGSGNGSFAKFCNGKFKKVSSYDVSGESITEKELEETEWDLIVLSDVLEHFEDIEELWDLNWEYAFISFPETPVVSDFNKLMTWRHYKPNEHIWCLNLDGFVDWIYDNGCKVIGMSNFEDFIRTRWDENIPNITSVLIKRM